MVVGVSGALFAVGLKVGLVRLVLLVLLVLLVHMLLAAAVDAAMAALGSNRLGLQGKQQYKADQRKLTQHHSAGPYRVARS
jgi:multisubunit Na+/H+ antiporter MnhG subunit